MSNTVQQLTAAGVALWLDDLNRTRVVSGDLTRMVEAEQIVGITTNPTIFSKAISAGTGYEDQIRELALRGTAIGETLRLLTAWDVRAACDILQPVYARTGHRDGRVSIEVDPRISADSARTVAEAKALWWLVDRPNLFIKIPATKAGLSAITDSITEGISVNVTLIFSLARYRAVLDAYMTGLEQRAAAGRSLADIESVASFFISRVDTEVDKRLMALDGDTSGDTQSIRGQAAIANARLAYAIYEQAEKSDRWRSLAAKGGSLQRLLWASTGVKDKAFAPTRYVMELVAPNTVNTMPEATLEGVVTLDQDIADTVTARYQQAEETANTLARFGIDLEDVADTLEREGIASFVKSWDELIASVEGQLKSSGADVEGSVVKPAGDDNAPASGAPRTPGTAGNTFG